MCGVSDVNRIGSGGGGTAPPPSKRRAARVKALDSKLTALRPVGIGLRSRLRGSILMGYLVSKFQYVRSTLSVAVYAYYHFPVSSPLT